MFKRKHLCVALAAAFAGGAGFSAFAQDAQKVERVEITGSSIKRIAGEGANPVIVINRAEIERSGATNAGDLIQALPSMQGFTVSSDSVNGGGGGITTASLRNLGSQYTLVLLNGHRIAPATSGSTVNLETLPLSMIDRVEVLTDGASALYGADAVAGVVNFITRKDETKAEISLTGSQPQHPGGRGAKVDFSKGIGNFDTDGYNIFLGAAAEKQSNIRAYQRDFTKQGGLLPFTFEGQNYLLKNLSSNSNPPNVTVNGRTYNPQVVLGNGCGSNLGSVPDGTLCRFNFAQTVELQPSVDRSNFYINGSLKLGNGFTAFGEWLYSDTSITAAFAAPAAPFSITAASPLWNRYIVPTFAQAGVVGVPTRATVRMRLSDSGLRTDQYDTIAQHQVAGITGDILGWDTTASYVRSWNIQKDLPKGGYVSFDKMTKLIANGVFDPFVQGSPASIAAIAPAVLTDNLSTVKSDQNVLSVRASRGLFNLPGGQSYLGIGAEQLKQRYIVDPSMILMGAGNPLLPPDYTDFPVGGAFGSVPTAASRTVYGIYGELLMPVFKDFELTAAGRYDSYSRAQNSKQYDVDTGLPTGSGPEGVSYSKSTYKFSLRYQPIQQLLLRGSFGTGFKPPSLAQITDPVTDFGVVSGFKNCPVTSGDPLFIGCRNFPYEYRAISGGNNSSGVSALRPENSKQFTLGFRVEPASFISVGLDYWSVKIDNAITSVDQDAAFRDFAKYRGLFSVTKEPGTGDDVLTLLISPINAASNVSKGVDWDISAKTQTSIGKVTVQFTGTYLIDSSYDFGFGGGRETSLGRFGSDGAVALRILARMGVTLDSGKFSNTVYLRYRSGYRDVTSEDTTSLIFDSNGNTVVDWKGLKIPSQYLFDWQGRYNFGNGITVVAGIKNLFDTKPPLSLKSTGSNFVGADARYSDTIGRTFYGTASYKF
jgi:iron complex outermembrane receptor protein